MDKTTIKPGTVVGRWTVLNDYTKNAKGEKKRLCRCECGTERYVLERALKSGGSLSCGCLRKQRIYEAVAHDVLGKTFGVLTVVGKSKRRTKHGTYWTCLCTCGYTCEATASELVSGSKTNCGCVTNIPKSMPIERRWGYLPGAGQLCRDCAIQIAVEEQAAMKRGFVYSLPVYGGKGERR